MSKMPPVKMLEVFYFQEFTINTFFTWDVLTLQALVSAKSPGK